MFSFLCTLQLPIVKLNCSSTAYYDWICYFFPIQTKVFRLVSLRAWWPSSLMDVSNARDRDEPLPNVEDHPETLFEEEHGKNFDRADLKSDKKSVGITHGHDSFEYIKVWNK